MLKQMLVGAVFASALAAAVPCGAAEALDSVFTHFDVKRCRHTPGTEEEDYGFWRRKGFAGIAVRLAAGDQRMTVSFGPHAANEPAAHETFAAFNDVYAGTIEWRLEQRASVRHHPTLERSGRRGRRRRLARPLLGSDPARAGRRLPGRHRRCDQRSLRRSGSAADGRQIRTQLSLRRGQAQRVPRVTNGRRAPSSRRRRPCRVPCRRISPTSAPRRGRRVPDRSRSLARCRTGPRPRGSSCRFAQGRAAPP